jgi:putative holliday junction resolvase
MGTSGRILAVDYGQKNIGLAYCDELGITVQPLPSISNSGLKDLISKLQAIIRALEIQALVLGMPINMDGSRGDAVLRMEQLMTILKAELKIPLSGVDERLSTVEATEIWQGMNRKQKKRYRTVDSLAAAFILDRYLKEM